ncbi:hypothetical protein LCGC14_0316010 [marine sediment metagenome]|uniref:Uncharacterized protein n=1 Tax=marine sediment metagenome TaxID=412755 RepID=A0A0F9TQQ9_9ZZZZ
MTQELINIGDILTSHPPWSDTPFHIRVTKVDVCKHGLVITGQFSDSIGEDACCFMPYEMSNEIDSSFSTWYGWGGAQYTYLPNGTKVGIVMFIRNDPRARIPEEYDKQWKETIQLMKMEQQLV